jgi:hypothetical protein
MLIETEQRLLPRVGIVCLCEGQDGVSASGHKRRPRHRPALAPFGPKTRHSPAGPRCRQGSKPDSRDHAHASRVAYCSSSRSRTSSDTKRSARCHASSLSPRNWKYFRNTTRWDVVSMATVCANCTKVLIL